MSQTPDQTKYILFFDAMEPGTTLQLGKAENVNGLIQAAELYASQTGLLEFTPDRFAIRKLYPWPEMESTVFGVVVPVAI